MANRIQSESWIDFVLEHGSTDWQRSLAHKADDFLYPVDGFVTYDLWLEKLYERKFMCPKATKQHYEKLHGPLMGVDRVWKTLLTLAERRSMRLLSAWWLYGFVDGRYFGVEFLHEQIRDFADEREPLEYGPSVMEAYKTHYFGPNFFINVTDYELLVGETSTTDQGSPQVISEHPLD